MIFCRPPEPLTFAHHLMRILQLGITELASWFSEHTQEQVSDTNNSNRSCTIGSLSHVTEIGIIPVCTVADATDAMM
jgi:hypothetical protein